MTASEEKSNEDKHVKYYIRDKKQQTIHVLANSSHQTASPNNTILSVLHKRV